jgi:hypothetical protein
MHTRAAVLPQSVMFVVRCVVILGGDKMYNLC